jgi:iron complex outermembrane receptor protein
MEARGRNFKILVRVAGLASVLAIVPGFASPGLAAAIAETSQFNIQKSSLSDGLLAYAAQANVQLVVNMEEIRGYSAPKVVGAYSREEALRRLIGKTPVTARWTGPNMLSVRANPKITPIAYQPPVPSSEPAAAAARTPSAALEEIVVTAQKRSENLQRVPITISAVTNKDLETRGIRSAFDLNVTIPGTTVVRSLNSPIIFTRGVGLAAPTPGNENTTAVYVDGVYYMAPIASVFSLTNIERIEVLKGPQGTLFGRNATGGLISIITREPKHETGGNISVSYGNFDTVTANGYLTTGLSEKVAGDVAFYVSNQGKGWGHNLVTGNEVYSRNESAIRSKLLLTPADDWKITLAGDYGYSDDANGLAKQPVRGTLVADGSPAPASIWDIAQVVDPYGKTRNFGGSVRVEHLLGWADFVSLSAYRKVTNRLYYDIVAGRTPGAILRFDPEVADWKTQEFQLQSPAGNKVKWIVGFYYLNGFAAYLPLAQSATVNGPVTNRYVRQKTQSYSAYAQTTFPIFDATNLTLGIRGTIDRRHALGYVQAPSGSISSQADLAHTWKSPTWRIALDHQFSPDVTAYLSYNRGFKSGVFSSTGLGPTSKPAGPEKLDAIEGGIKSELFDSRVRMNISAFHYNYRDQQVSINQVVNGQTATVFVNAAKSNIYGGELETAAKITDQLQVQGSVAYLHARYSSFPAAPCLRPRAGGGYIPFNCDASGNDMARSPRVTFNVGADYTVRVGESSVKASVNYYYNDGFFWDASDRLKQKSYDILNGQLAYIDPSGKWEAKVWARNLLNSEYYTFVSSGNSGDTGSPGEPRTYGVTISYKF